MPTYLYQCEKGHKFETSQGILEEPLTLCEAPKCNAKVKRLINNEGGFVLRGSGWTPKNYR